MPRKQVGIPETLGFPTKLVEGEFRIIRPEAPEEKQHAHERKMLMLRLPIRTFGIASVLTVALCWLCLHYGKPEIAERVVATVMGAIGGFGAARVMPGRD